VLAEADTLGQPLPVISAANEQYIRARAQGLGDADFSAVLEAVTPKEK
jgi:glyoxylate/succinic semialdehyde reductase